MGRDRITSSLHHLRAEILREGQPGLEHVEALLALREAPPSAPVPRKTDRRFKRGQLRIAILNALQDGSLTSPDLAARVSANDGGLTSKEAYGRIHRAIGRMRLSGEVVKDQGLWGLSKRAPLIGPVQPGWER